MSAQTEPEKYSIDEMMERLKQRPGDESIENGELVTRSDGSQAIRVRKRKRRSHQPHKEERKHTRRARMIQVSGALILLLLALFAAGAGIVYANSAPFRQGLIRKITATSGAKVDLQQFRMNPTSANANLLTLTWPEGNVLRDLTVRGIRAEIFPVSFLGKSMAGEEIKGLEGTVTLRFPDASKPAFEAADPAVSGPIRFKRYAIPKLHVKIGDPAASLLWMHNSEASFEPVSSSSRPQLLLNRGEIGLPGWPKLRMDRSHIEFRGTEVDIIGMRLHHETDNRGQFELSGTLSPYASDRPSNLSVKLDSFLIGGIAGPELGRLFSGRIDTVSSAKSNFLSFTPGPVPAATLAVDFRGTLTSNLEFSGFPFLVGVSQLLEDEWFERPLFETDITGSLRRAEGNIALGDLNFESKGRLAIRGALTQSKDRRLSGNLEIGLAEAMIKSSRNRRLDAMFGPLKDDFRWITLNISGSASSPLDNFKDLYEAAAEAVNNPPTGKVPSFEELTQPE